MGIPALSCLFHRRPLIAPASAGSPTQPCGESGKTLPYPPKLYRICMTYVLLGHNGLLDRIFRAFLSPRPAISLKRKTLDHGTGVRTEAPTSDLTEAFDSSQSSSSSCVFMQVIPSVIMICPFILLDWVVMNLICRIRGMQVCWAIWGRNVCVSSTSNVTIGCAQHFVAAAEQPEKSQPIV